MPLSPSRRRRHLRRLTGMAAAALVTVGLVSLAPTAQSKDQPVASDEQDSHVHFNKGKALGKAGDTPTDSVKDFFRSRGHNAATASSLKVDGAIRKSRGISHLRMTQEVAGLRVYDTYAKAALNEDGQLISLVENVADVPASSAPAAATIDPAAALISAVGSLYPNRSVDTRPAGKSGKTIIFAKDGFYAKPRVEQVAVPTVEGGMAVGYVVDTWTADDNLLYETLVAGDGSVVDHILRTAEDSYKVFPVDPGFGQQEELEGPGAGNVESRNGWLDKGPQNATAISGNNVAAYLDTDDDNAPDGASDPANGDSFLTSADLTASPDTVGNKEVAVQNLFYLNNVIHDTLYRAGFDEAAGNFQDKNFGKVGKVKDGDAVAAEAQDGGGLDNANFATPRDGRAPRMQMYLWTGLGTHTVSVGDGTAPDDYAASGAEFGPAVTMEGVGGVLAVVADGVGDGTTGTGTDGCEPVLDGSLTDKVAVVDRGFCNFVVKAKNLQAAGAVAMVVANNQPGQPFTMGPADPAITTLRSVMVDQATGAALKSAVGANARVHLTDPQPLMRDGSLDSDIVWHEYGHGLTWRMIGQMNGPLAGAIGEGMSDVLAMIANEDDLIGEYSASDPGGIRSAPYDEYERTYGDITGTGVHFDGEVYGAIGWDMLEAYRTAGMNSEVLLADLVDGMNYTPGRPTFEQMRDGILAGLATTGNMNRNCLVADAFARNGVGVGAKARVTPNSVSINESFRSSCGGDFTPAP